MATGLEGLEEAASALSELETGSVKAWHEDRGMGFIAPSTGGADLFVHRSNLVDGESLVVGAQVMFQTSFDERKGKPIATMIMGCVPAPAGAGRGAGVSPPAAAEVQALRAAEGSMQRGVVKVWLEDRGMGFITPEGGAADVFVHRSNLAEGQSLAQGMAVTFEIGWDVMKNKAIAKRVQGQGPPPAGIVTPAMQAMQVGLPSPSPPVFGLPPPLAAPRPGERTGLVKIWFEEKGYGFLTPEGGQPDIFVPRSALEGCTMLFQGSSVSFTSRWDTVNSKEIAATCSVLASGGSSTAGMSSGTVKVWFEDKGFGFITNDDGSGDAFVHRAALTDGQLLMAGAHVYFEAQYNAIKQKSTATKVVGASGGAPGGPRPGDVGNPAGNAAPMGAEQPTDNLFVSGLPLSMTEDAVKQIFGAYGAVISCKVLGANGKPDVAALVRMGTQDQAKWLVDNVDKNIPLGLTTPVNVRFAKASNDKPGSSFGQAASSTGAAAPRYNPYGGASVPDSWKSLMGGAAAPAPGAAPAAAAAAPNPVPALPGQLQPGVVKVWYEGRGMGFISPAAGGDDIFVHRTALVDAVGLIVGATVHFESSWDARKGKAIAKVCKVAADGVVTDSPMTAAPPVAGSAQPPAELLPEGWESAWSSEHSRTYYFNRKSGENVWEKPMGPSA